MELSRNAPSRVAFAGIALALIGVLTACGAVSADSGRDPVTIVPTGTLVMIIRHGEKPGEKQTGNLSGVDATGAPDDSSMTRTGWNRAHALAGIFAPDAGQPRAGLARPVAIFAAGANQHGDGTRTRQTVEPLAQKLGIRVNTNFGNGDERKLVEAVTAQTGPTLICWQHGEIPKIVKAFGNVKPRAPHRWPDSEYDVIWTLTKTSDGWAFAQQPEMALPLDDTNVIAG